MDGKEMCYANRLKKKGKKKKKGRERKKREGLKRERVNHNCVLKELQRP